MTGEWVLVSPHRTQRPWQGQTEQARPPVGLAYDPECYLCPGNARAGGHRNPAYEATFAFDNDFAALLPDSEPAGAESDLFAAQSERGVCRVVCFSPRHDLTLARMTAPAIAAVVDTWVAESAQLEARPWVRYVQIFENRGDMMGASNPHPHCQIWANERIPNEPAKELEQQRGYLARHGRCLLCDYLHQELSRGERLVCRNESFAALVPFWAVWPFEVLVLSTRHLAAMDEMTPEERLALADILRRITARYDRLFQCPFPYTMGFHPRPVNGGAHPEWHLHGHFYPPLLRSATVRKFMVGYEMLAAPQRDITPESAASRLRELPDA